MKREGKLIERIAEMSNLELAYYKAKKGKADKASVQDFGKHLQGHLRKIQAQLLAGHVEVGGYNYFTIYDPKKRQICAAPFSQRVLHHALMNVCHTRFERYQTADSFASRIGKGTYAALNKAQGHQKRCGWFLKLDVRKYFDSLDHEVLRQQLGALFKDTQLLQIFDQILDSYCVEGSRGVPIGNLTSQYFANHYLAPADHFAKEVLRLPGYIRYMDDMVLWHKDKATLLDAGLQFQSFIESELQLTLKPFCMNASNAGLPFLGYLVYPDTIRLAQRSRKRYTQKITEYELYLQQGLWTQEEFRRHAAPLAAFTEHADARAFRCAVQRTVEAKLKSGGSTE